MEQRSNTAILQRDYWEYLKISRMTATQFVYQQNQMAGNLKEELAELEKKMTDLANVITKENNTLDEIWKTLYSFIGNYQVNIEKDDKIPEERKAEAEKEIGKLTGDDLEGLRHNVVLLDNAADRIIPWYKESHDDGYDERMEKAKQFRNYVQEYTNKNSLLERIKSMDMEGFKWYLYQQRVGIKDTVMFMEMEKRYNLHEIPLNEIEEVEHKADEVIAGDEAKITGGKIQC